MTIVDYLIEAGYASSEEAAINIAESMSESWYQELVEKNGLWANIHAKRARIKRGSGEKMRKPGSKGAPTKQDFINSQD